MATTAVVLAYAAATNPLAYFTDNIASTGPTTTITVMEQALLDRINNASTSIDTAIYDFNRASIRDALVAAHNRGVIVRLVADDDAYANPGYSPHFAALEAAGITVVNDARSSIMHNKFFVIDGEVVWTGSTNISDNGFSYNHNNSVVMTSTLLADIYTIEFEEMFTDSRFGTAKSDNVTHTIDYDGSPLEVYFSPSDGALAEVIDEVNGATSDIRFGIFFLTDDGLRDALIAKLSSGVAISGVWDRLGAANQYSDDEALCNAGASIKIEDFGGKLHHKFMVIDAGGPSPAVITGSMNWSASGDTANDENTLIIHDGEVAQAYLAAYQALYDALGPETLCVSEAFLYLPLVVNPDLPPSLSIAAPANGDSFSSGTNIFFSGSAVDDRDGDISGSISWTSSIDGVIGGGASFSTSSLSAGVHTITASVTDSAGQAVTASITITVTAVDAAPTVTITAPADGSSFPAGTSVTFVGVAIDAEDGDISHKLAWSSNRDGAIGSGASFSTSSLSIGTHTITASATDSGGHSRSATITVTITGQANVRMVEIVYNPAGDDVAGENVRLRNDGSALATMTGWTLRDVANHVFTFPAFTLGPGGTVRVWTKSGANTGSDLYWGSGAAIWNNTGDTATLKDAGGQTVDVCSYGGGGVSASCN
jgi:phosphatidylserine/phosphatidylglycerophosphate/cardiolipin synthase-like enzyme